MANYPKTGNKETTVKMPDGWEKTSNLPDSPNTTKYSRWYDNLRVDLYHERRSNVYSYVIMNLDKSYSTGKFQAESLEKAQKLAYLMVEANFWWKV